jgi:hypothetical protein
MSFWDRLTGAQPDPDPVPAPRPRPIPPAPSIPPPQGPSHGDTWTGPTMWTTDPHIGRPGYYALSPEGAILDPPVMLTWVDEAPGNDEDGSGHFVVSTEEPYFSHLPESINPASPRVVNLEAHTHGTGGVSIA